MAAKEPDHHYVPVFYLNQWRDTSGRIFAYTRPHKEVVVSPKPPTHTGYEPGLYSLKGLDPAAANKVEEVVLGEIDNDAAVVHRTLLAGGNLDSESKRIWTRFIVCLMIRSPAMIQSILRGMTTPGTKDYIDASKWYSEEFGARYEDIPADVMARFAMYTFEKLLHQVEVFQFIEACKWDLCDLGPSELHFFTSDRPVILTNGLQADNGHLALPLSSKKLLIVYGNEEVRRAIRAMSSLEIRDAVNKEIVQRAVKIAWDNSDQSLPYMRDNFGKLAHDDRDFFKLS